MPMRGAREARGPQTIMAAGHNRARSVAVISRSARLGMPSDDAVNIFPMENAHIKNDDEYTRGSGEVLALGKIGHRVTRQRFALSIAAGCAA